MAKPAVFDTPFVDGKIKGNSGGASKSPKAPKKSASGKTGRY